MTTEIATTATANVEVTIKVLDAPSRSKGWGRYASATAAGTPVTKSTTGNPWVGSTTKTGQVAAGATFTVTSQVMLNVGAGRTARQEITSESWTLIAAPGESVELTHRPGSQGQTLRISNARLAG